MEGEGRGGAIAPERRGLCAGGESNAAFFEAPPRAPALVPPPGRRRLPRRPVLAAAGQRWGAASRRFGGGWAEPARGWATSRVSLAPRGACLYAAFPLPAPGSSGGRDRYSPSQISPERKLGAVSRKGAFMAELGGTCVHKTGSQEPSGLSECLCCRNTQLLERSQELGSVYSARCTPPLGCSRRLPESAERLLGGACPAVRSSKDADLFCCTPCAQQWSPGQVGVSKSTQKRGERGSHLCAVIF